MLDPISLEEISSGLGQIGAPVSDTKTIIDRIRAIDAQNPTLGFFPRVVWDQSFRSLRGINRHVSQMSYLTHIARTSARTVDQAPEPITESDWYTAAVSLAASTGHDTPEEKVAKNVRTFKERGGEPSLEDRMVFRRFSVMEATNELLSSAENYNRVSPDFDLELARKIIKDLGYSLDKVTRERGNLEIDPSTANPNYWSFAEELLKPRAFPRSVEDFPKLSTLFNGGKSNIEHATLALSLKLLDRADVIGVDLYPPQFAIEYDKERRIQALAEGGNVVSAREIDKLDEEFRVYSDAAAFFEPETLSENADLLRRAHEEKIGAEKGKEKRLAQLQFSKLSKRLRSIGMKNEKRLTRWGSHLMTDSKRISNLGKTFVMIDLGYKHLDSLTNRSSYSARMLESSLAYTVEVFEKAVEREIDRYLVLFADRSLPDSISLKFVEQFGRKVEAYMRLPDIGTRFAPDSPEEVVENRYREVHRFSRLMRAFMGGDPEAKEKMKSARMRYRMAAIMQTYMPAYQGNTQKNDDFFFMSKPSAVQRSA